MSAATKTRVLVLGDVMLDQFIWGSVARISPEAPVPVVDFERESFMPGGAANVARNLTALERTEELFGAIGNDSAASQLGKLLGGQKIGCTGLVKNSSRTRASRRASWRTSSKSCALTAKRATGWTQSLLDNCSRN